MNLLDSLETFLSTFQKDLSAVSGQISELQSRSKDIDSRLKSRRVSFDLDIRMVDVSQLSLENRETTLQLTL